MWIRLTALGVFFPVTQLHKESTSALSPSSRTHQLSIQSWVLSLATLDQDSRMFSLTSSAFCKSPISLTHQESGSNKGFLHHRPCSHNLQVFCQAEIDSTEHRTANVSRRSITVATLLGISAELYGRPEAQAARKKNVEAEEKKPKEDKSLSAYDAKLLATYRRKEAMKEAMAKQRAKAKPIGGSPAPTAEPAAPAPEPKPEEPTASVAATSAPEQPQAVSESIAPTAE